MSAHFISVFLLTFLAKRSDEASAERCIMTVGDGGAKYISPRKFDEWAVNLVPRCTRDYLWRVMEKAGEFRLEWIEEESLNHNQKVYINIGEHNRYPKFKLPSINADGSWSIELSGGAWLSVNQGGTLTSGLNSSSTAQFWLVPTLKKHNSTASENAFENSEVPPTEYYDEYEDSSEYEDNSEEEGWVETSEIGCLRTHNAKFIHFYKTVRWEVHTSSKCMRNEYWTIDEKDNKVRLKSIEHQRFLREHPNGFIDLASDSDRGTLWNPIEQDDGSWQLESENHALLDESMDQLMTQSTGSLISNFWILSITSGSTITKSVASSSSNDISRIVVQMLSSQQLLASNVSGLCYFKTSKDHVALHVYDQKNNRTGMHNRCVLDDATHCWRDELWFIENWEGRIVIKSVTHSSLLRAFDNGTVNLTDEHDSWNVTWNAFRNNKSWSFLSVHGMWLSFYDNILVTRRSKKSDTFWLDSAYIEPDTCEALVDETPAEIIGIITVYSVVSIIFLVINTFMCTKFYKRRTEDKKLRKYLKFELPSMPRIEE